MQFNKDQREGIAKVMDNLATAAMVTSVVAGVVDHKIGWDIVSGLVVLFFLLLSVAFILRKGDDNGH